MLCVKQIHVLIVKGPDYNEMQSLINRDINKVSIGDCSKIYEHLKMDVYHHKDGSNVLLMYKNKIYSLNLQNNFIVYFESNYYDSQPIKNIGDIVNFMNKNSTISI